MEITKEWIKEDSIKLYKEIGLKKWMNKNKIFTTEDLISKKSEIEDIEPFLWFVHRFLKGEHIEKLFLIMSKTLVKVLGNRRELTTAEKVKRWYNKIGNIYSDVSYKNVDSEIKEFREKLKHPSKITSREAHDMKLLSDSLTWEDRDFNTYYAGQSLSNMLWYYACINENGNRAPEYLYLSIMNYHKALYSSLDNLSGGYKELISFCKAYIQSLEPKIGITGNSSNIDLLENHLFLKGE